MNEYPTKELAGEVAAHRRDAQNRRPWRKPDLKAIGSIGSVLHGGGGKLSPSTFDPGDIRKPPGLG